MKKYGLKSASQYFYLNQVTAPVQVYLTREHKHQSGLLRHALDKFIIMQYFVI